MTTFILEKSKTGYGVQSPQYPNVFSYGDTLEQAVNNMKIAINEYIEYVDNNLVFDSSNIKIEML